LMLLRFQPNPKDDCNLFLLSFILFGAQFEGASFVTQSEDRAGVLAELHAFLAATISATNIFALDAHTECIHPSGHTRCMIVTAHATMFGPVSGKTNALHCFIGVYADRDRICLRHESRQEENHGKNF
jgi:hypothetical protein